MIQIISVSNRNGEGKGRNGMSHGLPNDIIMRNLTGKHACVCRAFFGANLREQSLCRSIYYCFQSKGQIETQLIHQIGSLFIVTLEGKKRSLNVKSG